MEPTRNYRLIVEHEADGDWYKPAIDRDELLALMKRSNKRAFIDLLLWIVLLVSAGWFLVVTWFSPWTALAAVVYGTLYGSASDARWHECGHRTAFASKRLNDIVYHFASFMVVREPISWRWSHVRHHAETIFVGRDPEIAFPRPMPRWRIAAELFGLLSAYAEGRKYLLSFVGRVPTDVRSYVPEREVQRVIFWSRIHVIAHTSVIALSVYSASLLPMMMIGLPSLYGRWLLFVLGSTQHAGLEEDLFDHRRTTRSVQMNPVVRFLYLNMNHHLEHHLFPSVPYHRLPELQERLSSQLPRPNTTLFDALREVRSQLKTIREMKTISGSGVGTVV